MRFLLRLKHWQLFLLTWGVPLLVSTLSFSNPALLFRMFPVTMTFFLLGTYGWIWAIATELHDKLPEGVKLKVAVFRILILIPSIYILSIVLWAAFGSYGGSDVVDDSVAIMMGVSLFVVHLLSMLCIVLSIRFAAKTLKSVELGRMAKFNDYIGEFFLIWMSPIGVWILQPRLNKLTEN